jgi:hypothetical protein
MKNYLFLLIPSQKKNCPLLKELSFEIESAASSGGQE